MSLPFWVGQRDWICRGNLHRHEEEVFFPTDEQLEVSNSPALLYFFVLGMLKNRWKSSWATISNSPNWMWAPEQSFPPNSRTLFLYNLPDLHFPLKYAFDDCAYRHNNKCPWKKGAPSLYLVSIALVRLGNCLLRQNKNPALVLRSIN